MVAGLWSHPGRPAFWRQGAVPSAALDVDLAVVLEEPSAVVLSSLRSVRDALTAVPRAAFDIAVVVCAGARGLVGRRAHRLSTGLWYWELCAGYLETVEGVSRYAARLAMRALEKAASLVAVGTEHVTGWLGQLRDLGPGERHGRHLVGTTATREAFREAARTFCSGGTGDVLLGDEVEITLRRPVRPGVSQKDRCPCGDHRNGDRRPSLVHGKHSTAKCMATGRLFRVVGGSGHKLRIRPIGIAPSAPLRYAPGQDHPNGNHGAGGAASQGRWGRLDGRVVGRAPGGDGSRVRSIWTALLWSEQQSAGPVATERARILLEQARDSRDVAGVLAASCGRAVSLDRQRATGWREIPVSSPTCSSISVPTGWEPIGGDLVLWRLCELEEEDVSGDRVRAAVALVVSRTPELVGEAAAVRAAPNQIDIVIRARESFGAERYTAIGEDLLAALRVSGAVDPAGMLPDRWLERPAHRVIVDEDDDGVWTVRSYRSALLFVDARDLFSHRVHEAMYTRRVAARREPWTADTSASTRTSIASGNDTAT